jgi:hypothetical protein
MREVRSTPGGEHPDEPQRIRLDNAQRPVRPRVISFFYRKGLRICAEKKIDKYDLTSVWEAQSDKFFLSEGFADLRGEEDR